MLRGLAKNKVIITAIITPIHGNSILFIVSPEKEPIRKDVRLIDISAFISLIVLIPALRKEDTVMPARTIVVRELSAKYARAYIQRVVRSAPAKAAKEPAYTECGNISIDNITKNPAPEFTPIVLGLARALFMTLCRITPATDKPIPAIIAPNILGILIFIIRIYVTEDLSFPDRHLMISNGLSHTLPSIILKKEAATSIAARIISV